MKRLVQKYYLWPSFGQLLKWPWLFFRSLAFQNWYNNINMCTKLKRPWWHFWNIKKFKNFIFGYPKKQKETFLFRFRVPGNVMEMSENWGTKQLFPLSLPWGAISNSSRENALGPRFKSRSGLWCNTLHNTTPETLINLLYLMKTYSTKTTNTSAVSLPRFPAGSN